MAVTPIIPVLLLTLATRCRSDHTNGFNANNNNSPSQYGHILKPPPPPQLASIVPVPFHLGPERNQRHNPNVGYHYQAPSPPPPPSEYKFPAPFYKQYNFNFVPHPQPFSTTPSPSMFQKMSEWLFPSQETNYAQSTIFKNNNIVAPIKKDCNPCNLVPWLPVIRYNVGAKNVYQNPLSTYGPPNPTAYADALKVVQKYPTPFNQQNLGTKPPQLTPGIPHANYGPPAQKFNNAFAETVSSTYGPPSVTHTIDTLSPHPPTSTFSQPSTSYGNPNTPLVSSNNAFNSHFLSTHSQELSNNVYNIPSSTYRSPSSSYATPASVYGIPYPNPPVTQPLTYLPVTPQYDPGMLNKELPEQADVELLENVAPIAELQVPKYNKPTTFKNSYGEPITNTHLFDISYPISATAAESSKIKTKVLPEESKNSTTTNISFALANPAPFTLNKGRNIHTLQPVALPNLSVSPLPPIFNARPFRPERPQFPKSILHGINHMQQSVTNVHIQQSIPLTEYTHSVDYPATFIQSPIIEIDAPTISNQTKGYRNIPNSYVVDEIRDISSQASESVSTKSISDASFESTGVDFGNDLYDSGIPVDLKQPSGVPSNHRPEFADLRGMNDEDLDKYRTENNLQNIDSPLLYLKPSAPHKNHGNFILAVSSPIPENEYEIYDDSPTTAAPLTPTLTSNWDDSRDDYREEISPSFQEKKYKPKIVQIIVPYTTRNEEPESNDDFVEMARDWPSTPKDEYQARKVPSNTDYTHIYTATEIYATEPTTTTEESLQIPQTDYPDLDQYHPTGILKDLDDVKEPPFDIIKLQHTIDDWTQQEYSKQYKSPQKTRTSEIYAKKIPDNYFTTPVPANHVTTTINYNNEFYDHEGSSSIQHTVTDDINNKTKAKPRKEYNVIERPKNSYITSKKDQSDEAIQRFHIYTAASSFRTTSTTTTPAPWGKIQTSISPLTNEKVYVVTSKPWKETRNISKEWYDIEPFQSMKINSNSDISTSSKFPFKSPRFLDRPSFDFNSGGKIESDSSYGFSKSWFQSINELETQKENDSASMAEARRQKDTSEMDEV
ncbi:unnamed protein product [Arctia plantaginis]|uniref:Uncharacterized protein n=1 Tax=Arctia plantaginis TaxID=874455 RepID=A0A8S0Z894_ARCPL|nr:unnamed protein product [Arctia plantaginis]